MPQRINGSRKPAEPFIVDGKERCGAKKRDGTPCKRFPMNGTHRCRTHGGASALANMGAGNPSYKHGRYMVNPRVGFVDRMQHLLADEALRSLNSEIALVTYRVEELLQTEGHPGALWEDAEKAYQSLTDGMNNDEPEEVAGALHSLREIIDGGIKLNESWQEIYTAVELRRKLVDSVHRHELQTGMMLSVAEWSAGAGRLLEATKNVVRILTESKVPYDYESAMALVADEFDAKMQTIEVAND